MFDIIQSVISQIGYVGIAALMFAENVFPPIPSELIMPLAGFTAANGDLNVVGVLLSGIVGALAGAVLWYWIGRGIGARRIKALSAEHGRWLTVSPEEFDRAQAWFDRHGGQAVLIGRLIPTVRTFISVPAGLSRMPFWRFTLYSTLGTALWTALLTAAGYLLEAQHDRVHAWLDPVSTAVVVGLASWYVWRVVTYRRRVPRPGGGRP